MRLLIAEDEPDLATVLQRTCEDEGWHAETAADGGTALAMAQVGAYDLVILDLMLPVLDGWQLLARLRAQGQAVPVLVLTARDAVPDRVRGLDAGADDYLTKPFALAELEVRIEALLARSRGRRRKLQVEDLAFDLDTQSAQRGSRHVPLSHSARRLLEALMRASPAVVTRTELESTLWGDDPPEGDMLRSHMYELRRAIDGDSDVKLLHTLRGVGYLLAARGENR